MKLAITAAPLPPAPLDYQGFIEKSKEFAKKLKLDWEDVEVRVYNGTRKRTFKDSKGKQYTLEKGGMFMVLEDDDEGDIYLFIEGMRLPFEPSQRVYDTLMETSKKTSKKTTTKVSKPALPKSDEPVDKASKNPFINTPFNLSKLREGYVDNAGDYYDYRSKLEKILAKQVKIGKYTLEYEHDNSSWMDAVYTYNVKLDKPTISVTFDPLSKPNFHVAMLHDNTIFSKDVGIDQIEKTIEDLSIKALLTKPAGEKKAEAEAKELNDIVSQITVLMKSGGATNVSKLTDQNEIEARNWGKWEVPETEEDDGDYDWKVLTPTWNKSLGDFITELNRTHKHWKTIVQDGEKCWLTFQIMPKK